MNFFRLVSRAKKMVIILGFFASPYFSFSQQLDSTKTIGHFGGAVTVTNNGISLFPNFYLGKPAALFDMAVGKGKLSFEPQFRFALEGKPWSFIFWWRYKAIKTDRFALNFGVHPALTFKTISLATNGVSKEYITTQRYLAAETTPTYFFNKKTSIGIHYLFSHGFESDVVQNTHYLALRSSFSNITLSKQFALTFVPQFYILKMDAKKGVYVSATTVLTKLNSPLSISSIVSQSLKTDIAGKDFVWNVSLTYAFDKKYVKL